MYTKKSNSKGNSKMQPKKGKLPPQFLKKMQARKSGKRVTAAQAKSVAARLSKKAPMVAGPVDAEDMLDGGADEAKEKS